MSDSLTNECLNLTPLQIDAYSIDIDSLEKKRRGQITQSEGDTQCV